MAGRASDPAFPLDTEGMDWIATGPGKSFRPLRFEAGGWTELMRLEPGSGVPLHRHSGEVHAYCLIGSREILGTGEIAGPGSYVYEPGGTIDAASQREAYLGWCAEHGTEPAARILGED